MDQKVMQRRDCLKCLAATTLGLPFAMAAESVSWLPA